jgi:cystathionine beta-lyase
MQRRYGWEIQKSWLVGMSGVVPGIYASARLSAKNTSSKSNTVLLQSPDYHHFFEAVEHAGKKPLAIRHSQVQGRWQMDLDHLRELAKQGADSFLLCNPHNPLGRVLDSSELEAIVEVCLQEGILLCSDEIHSDLVLDEDKSHIPIASLSPAIAAQTITLIAPTKTFNLPGVGSLALAIIPDEDLRKAFEKQIHGLSVHPSGLAYTAALAAYRDCTDWHDDLLTYLRANRDYLQERIDAIEGLSMTHVEATFLAWIDTSKLALNNPFAHFLAYGVAMSDGTEMGDRHFLRLNFACSRSTLTEILDRIEKAAGARVSGLVTANQYPVNQQLSKRGQTMSNPEEKSIEIINNAMQKARAVNEDESFTRAELEQLEQQMQALISAPELFTTEHYPDPPADSPGCVYLIAEDEGCQNSLYLVCAAGGADVPPHDHKTWAVVGGLSGVEENTLFERIDDGSVSGAGELKETGRVVLKGGDTIALMPLDIHTIAAVGGPTRHLHWYGKGFSQQTGKVAFKDGACFEVPADMVPVDESRRVI